MRDALQPVHLRLSEIAATRIPRSEVEETRTHPSASPSPNPNPNPSASPNPSLNPSPSPNPNPNSNPNSNQVEAIRSSLHSFLFRDLGLAQEATRLAELKLAASADAELGFLALAESALPNMGRPSSARPAR